MVLMLSITRRKIPKRESPFIDFYLNKQILHKQREMRAKSSGKKVGINTTIITDPKLLSAKEKRRKNGQGERN